MSYNVVTVPNLGNEFDLGVIEANKIHVKLGEGLTRDPLTGEISVVPAADVHVDDVSWNPATNELTVTLTDTTAFVVDLGTLAADKFLSSSSFDPETNILTLVMTDASEYQVDLGDLVSAQTGVGIKGDGTTGTPIEFEASSLPAAGINTQQPADKFVMSTQADPDGALVPVGNAAFLVYRHLMDEAVLGVDTGVGISGVGDGENGPPIEFAAEELPHHWEDEGHPEVYFVMSGPYRPAGYRVNTVQMAAELWTIYMHNEAEDVAETTVNGMLTVDVQDAFGNHLFYALP